MLADIPPITILDYGAGNLTSVCLAFEHIGVKTVVVSDAANAPSEGNIVFPGVGAAASGMAGLRARGFDKLLSNAASEGRRILGICLGMQLLLDESEEDGGQQALGLVPGRVKLFRFPPASHVKIPHIGWNQIVVPHAHPVLEGISNGTAFYFVHSYYAAPASKDSVFGMTDYAGCAFASIVGGGSIIATQFHPERSGEAGLLLLKNFSHWNS